MSNSLRPHGLQHTRPPCPSPTLELTQTQVHRIGDAIQPSYPLSSPSPPTFNLFHHQGLFQWVSSSNQMGQSTGVLASTSVLPVNTQDWSPFRMDWLDLLAVQGTLKSLLQHHSSKVSIFRRSALHSPTLTSIHDYWKNCSFDYTDVSRQNNVSALSRFVIAFLPRSKCF